MKYSLVIMLATFALMQTACKKERKETQTEVEDDGLGAEASQIAELYDDHTKLENGDLKALLDTNSLPETDNYIVLFKSSFQAPLAESYKGSDDGKADAAATSSRDTRIKVLDHFEPEVLHDTNVIQWFSVLSSGFYAKLTREQVKAIYRDENVKCIATPPAYEDHALPSYTNGTYGLFVHGYKSGLGSNKRIWIIDGGGDLNSSTLRVDQNLSNNFTGQDMEEGSWHGMAVAQIAGAKENGAAHSRGTAEGAQLVILKKGSWASINDALEYCWKYSKKGDIVNISFGLIVKNTSAQKALVAELENNILDFNGWDMPFTISAGNDGILASSLSPSRLGLKYKDEPAKYGFINVVANIIPVGTETEIRNATCKFALNDAESSNYGRAVRWGLIGTWLRVGSNGVLSAGSGTSYAAPALAGILYHNTTPLAIPKTLTNVVKYTKNGSSYTHLVPTLK